MNGARPCAAAAALAALALGCASPAPPPGETVTFRFDWPPGMVALVEGERSHLRREDGEAVPRTIAYASAVAVEADGDTRVVRFQDLELRDPQTGDPVDPAALPAEDEQFLRALQSVYRVDPDGRLLEVAGRPTEDGVALRARQRWRRRVELLAGRSLAPGETLREEDFTVVPVLGGALLPSEIELRVGARVPCTEGAADARCVEVEGHAAPSAAQQEALREALARARALGPEGEAGVEGLEVSEELYLVTEPETLRPYYVESTRRLRLEVREADGSARAVEELLQDVERYQYLSESALAAGAPQRAVGP